MTPRSAPARTLAFGSVVVALASNDAAAADWLAEVSSPSFAPTREAADWRIRLASDAGALRALAGRRPPDAALRACFAQDTRVVTLPAWPEGAGGVALADEQRSCLLVVSPGRVDLVGDPVSRRWRMTSMWTLHEIAATRFRRSHLDLHAAAVEAAGRAILIVGRKGAGKTTLSLHLLRSGRCRAIANDRAFVGPAGASFEARGVPTIVTVRPPTTASFPELRRGVSGVERAYLYTIDELARTPARQATPDPAELQLTPAQLVQHLHVESLGAAPAGAIVFPEIRPDRDGTAVEPLAPEDVAAEIWANLYGGRIGPRAPTIFEELTGGLIPPSRAVAEALAASVPGYRAVLGPRAYDEPEFAGRLLDAVLA